MAGAAELLSTFVLPDIKVPWFVTLTGTTEFATIPARKDTGSSQSGSATANTPTCVTNKNGDNTRPCLQVQHDSNTLVSRFILARLVCVLLILLPRAGFTRLHQSGL